MGWQREFLWLLLQMMPKSYKRRLGVHLGAPDVSWSLFQLKRFGFSPDHVMDVGAYRGDWARACMNVFPDATVTCVEPQESVQWQLRALASENHLLKVVQVLVGRKVNPTVSFSDIGSGSSVLLHRDPSTTRVMTTIDTLVTDGICKPPQLLKLDVQGYEIEVLEGFSQHLDQCEVIQCELSLLPIAFGAPLIHEVLTYLYKRGFVMFDITELIRAPSDGCVWQIDALFCRMDSPLRRERAW